MASKKLSLLLLGVLFAAQGFSITGEAACGDYLAQCGGNTRWPIGKNIKVYVAPGRTSYMNMVISAMNLWATASRNAFSWQMVGNPKEADYTISWTGRQREVSTGTEAGVTSTDTISGARGRETIQHAHTRVLTHFNGNPLSDKDVSDTILHEIGHGLGLEGHSSNPRDIMYYAAERGQTGLTARDMNTMARLYAR